MSSSARALTSASRSRAEPVYYNGEELSAYLPLKVSWRFTHGANIVIFTNMVNNVTQFVYQRIEPFLVRRRTADEQDRHLILETGKCHACVLLAENTHGSLGLVISKTERPHHRPYLGIVLPPEVVAQQDSPPSVYVEVPYLHNISSQQIISPALHIFVTKQSSTFAGQPSGSLMVSHTKQALTSSFGNDTL